MTKTTPKTGEERIAAVRKIVDERQFAKIDDTILDLFSASVIVAVYDKLSEPAREKYRNMNVRQMAHIAFKLIK